MPMMEKLLAQIQETPPQSVEELEQLLSETGYRLTPVEPERVRKDLLPLWMLCPICRVGRSRKRLECG